jgi:hypothetical protein
MSGAPGRAGIERVEVAVLATVLPLQYYRYLPSFNGGKRMVNEHPARLDKFVENH